MTISVEGASTGPYYPNGVTTNFPFDFKILNEDEIAFIREDDDGSQTVISPGLYSVNIESDGEGGAIIFDVPPSASVLPHFAISDPAFLQGTLFEDEGPFNSAILNPAFDRAVILALALKRDLARTAKVPLGEEGFALARSAVRSGRIFAFDGDGAQDFQLTVASILTSFENVAELQDWRGADLSRIVQLEARAVLVPDGEAGLVLPVIADRASRLARFDAGGAFSTVAPATGPDWSVVVLDSAGAPHSVQLGDLIEQAVSGDLDGGVWGDDPANLDGGVWV